MRKDFTPGAAEREAEPRGNAFRGRATKRRESLRSIFFLWALEPEQDEFAEEARLAPAIKLYEKGKMLTGLAAQLGGAPRVAFFYLLGNSKEVNTWKDASLFGQYEAGSKRRIFNIIIHDVGNES